MPIEQERSGLKKHQQAVALRQPNMTVENLHLVPIWWLVPLCFSIQKNLLPWTKSNISMREEQFSTTFYLCRWFHHHNNPFYRDMFIIIIIFQVLSPHVSIIISPSYPHIPHPSPTPPSSRSETTAAWQSLRIQTPQPERPDLTLGSAAGRIHLKLMMIIIRLM